MEFINTHNRLFCSFLLNENILLVFKGSFTREHLFSVHVVLIKKKPHRTEQVGSMNKSELHC